MAQECLCIPDEHVLEVVAIIRSGLQHTEGTPGISLETIDKLTAWCRGEEAHRYARRNQNSKTR